MPKTIRIVSIGAGNIAHHFIPALHGIPCEISQVYSRNIKHANHLAHIVNAESIDKFSDIDHAADFYLIMVPDDAIASVVAELPQLNENQFVAHTSGATPSYKLKSLGPNYGAFYALQTFRINKTLNLSKTPFLIYGNDATSLRFFRTLARKLSSKVQEVNDKERLIYHLCAVLVNNYTNHLACIAKEILDQEELDSEVLSPIIKTTYNTILENDACENQTGPARRKDISLQRRHLRILDDNPEWQNLYKALSRSINKMYNENSK